MTKWYVLQVMSGHEQKVKRSLGEMCRKQSLDSAVEEIMVPVEKISEMKKGELKVRENNIYPGYIFVNMTMSDDLWHKFKEVQGVISFLGGDKPSRLSDDEVTSILDDQRNKKEKVSPKFNLKPGEQVKINDGPFENFSGKIVEVSQEKGSLSVMVSIFGRETKVDDLDFSKVDAISNE